MLGRAAVVCFALLLGVSTAFAAETLSYQGLLKDPGGLVIPDGTYSLTFRLYSQSSGGAPLWNETQSLPVRDGVFSIGAQGVVYPSGPSYSYGVYGEVNGGSGTNVGAYGHVQVTGNTQPEYAVRLDTAGSPEGQRIEAKVSLEKGEVR